MLSDRELEQRGYQYLKKILGTPHIEVSVIDDFIAFVRGLEVKVEESKGHWQKEIPSKSGQYWTADRRGSIAGIKIVIYDTSGKLLFAGNDVSSMYGVANAWQGWWWSEPLEEPPPPSKWEE